MFVGATVEGPTGEMLRKMIGAMKLKDGEVFLSEVGADAGAGDASGLHALRKRLDEEIKSVSPAVIVAFGEEAARLILDETGIESLRGRFHEYAGLPVMPVYSLQTLLDEPALKRPAWDDLQMVMERLKLKR
jgi:DNA polymerase